MVEEIQNFIDKWINSYIAGIMLIIIGVYTIYNVRKYYDKKSLGIISPYYDGLHGGIGLFALGLLIIIMKIVKR